MSFVFWCPGRPDISLPLPVKHPSHKVSLGRNHQARGESIAQDVFKGKRLSLLKHKKYKQKDENTEKAWPSLKNWQVHFSLLFS